MNEATLRRWARGQLSTTEEMDVYQWMVTCTSPTLPRVLSGLIREAQEERADATARGRGGLWAYLADRWNDLLELGQSEWVAPAEVMPAAADDRWATLHELEEGSLVLAVERGDARAVAVFVSTDAPSVRRLAVDETAQHQEVVVPEGPEPRPTVWAVRGDLAAVQGADEVALEEALRAEERGEVEVVAVRWRG